MPRWRSVVRSAASPCRTDAADDAAFPAADIGDRHAGDGAEPLAQQRRRGYRCAPRCRPGPDQRVIHGGAEAELRRVVVLPVLEAARIRAQLVAVRRGPVRRMQVEKGRLQPVEDLAPHIEEAAAARPAQIFAAGRRQQVAADRRRRRPASARPTGRRRADRGCRARGRSRPISAAGLTRPPLVGTCVMAISLTRPSIMRASASTSSSPARRRWGRPRSTAPVRRCRPAGRRCSCWRTRPARSGCGRPAAKRDGIERHVPGHGGVLDQRDLVGAGADQPGDGRVDIRDPALRLVGRLIAADLGFALRCGRSAPPAPAAAAGAAPALLKWTILAVAGVSRRTFAMSMVMESA